MGWRGRRRRRRCVVREQDTRLRDGHLQRCADIPGGWGSFPDLPVTQDVGEDFALLIGKSSALEDICCFDAQGLLLRRHAEEAADSAARSAGGLDELVLSFGRDEQRATLSTRSIASSDALSASPKRPPVRAARNVRMYKATYLRLSSRRPAMTSHEQRGRSRATSARTAAIAR
eukprot:scaffold249325_cov30-Tisochrysis_lutea.AAC.4